MSGTTVDPRIPLGARTPEMPNPLTQLGQLAQVGTAVTQMQQAQEQFQARQTLGPLLQRAIDPATGQYDPLKFNRLLAREPSAAFLTPEMLNHSQAAQLSQAQLQQEQLRNSAIRLDHINRTLSGLLAQPGELSQADVLKHLVPLLNLPAAERPFEATTAAAALGTMPNNPAAIRQWLETKMVTAQQAEAQLRAIMPQAMPVQTGGATETYNRDPLTGQVTPAPGTNVIPNTPTPGERNDPVRVWNPNTNQYELAPRTNALPMYNGVGQPANGRPASPLGTGRYPTQGAAAAPGAPPLTQAAGPALGQEQLATVGAEAVQGLQTRAAEVPQTRAVLADMDRLVREFTSGQGADWARIARSFQNFVAPSGFQIQPQNLASQEEFNKLAFRIAQQQYAGLTGGQGGSNMQLQSVMGSSPSELLSRLGNQGVIAMLRGNEDATDVMHREWQKYAQARGGGTAQWGQFLAEWNQRFNPRVFAFRYMSPESRERMMAAMTPQQREETFRQYAEAIENGWTPAPRAVRRQLEQQGAP